MRKLFKCFSVMLVLLVSHNLDVWAEDINYFEVASNIAKPVTIKTNLGDYSFYDSFTLRGHISRIEAFDAKGNRIVNTQPYKYSTSGEHWYRFDRIYSSSSPSTSSSSTSSSTSSRSNSYSSGSYSSGGNSSASWNMFQGAMSIASYSDDPCNIQLRGGWSLYNAENVSTKFCLDGFYLTGVIGKDLFSKSEEEKLRWSAGAGMRLVFDDISSDLCFGFKAGNRGQGIDGFIDAEWTTWLFDTIFGFYANIGVGTPYDKEFIFALEKFYFDIQIGVAIKLFRW